MIKRYIFAEGNKIGFGQDFSFSEGVPANIEFEEIEEIKSNGMVKLSAPGYGGQPYGNGSIYVKRVDLDKLSQSRRIQRIDFPSLYTGAFQMSDDWTGLFIRGDDCIKLMLILRKIIAKEDLDNYQISALEYYCDEIETNVIQ